MADDSVQQRMNRGSQFRIASASKNRPFCYLCDSRTGLSSRVAVNIFTNGIAEETGGGPVAATLSEILQRTINETSAHSHVICKKCLKICGEYQAAVNRLNSVKENIISIYNSTLTKLNLNRTDGESSDSHTETGDVGRD